MTHQGSGVARPSGLGGHTYRWVSAARLGEDQKNHNFPSSRRYWFVMRILHFEIIPVCPLCTTTTESRRRYGPLLAKPLHQGECFFHVVFNISMLHVSKFAKQVAYLFGVSVWYLSRRCKWRVAGQLKLTVQLLVLYFRVEMTGAVSSHFALFFH